MEKFHQVVTNQSLRIVINGKVVFEAESPEHLSVSVCGIISYEEKKKLWKLLDRRLDYLHELDPLYDLPKRAIRALADRDTPCEYIGDVVQLSETDFRKTKDFGRKSQRDLMEILAELRVPLGSSVYGWVRPEERRRFKPD